MKRIRWSLSSEVVRCLLTVLAVVAITVVLLLVGPDRLDKTIIALCYLLPVGWSAARWGPGPTACAALAALLVGEFFISPPLYTFTAGRVVAWLVLATVLLGANVVAARMKAGLSKGPDTVYAEYQAVFVHGLRAALAGLPTQEAVIYALATYLQQLFQAPLVEVHIQPRNSLPMMVRAPADGLAEGVADRTLSIGTAPDLEGEIHLWGDGWLPPEDSYLFRSLVAEATWALERARLPKIEMDANALLTARVGELVTASGE